MNQQKQMKRVGDIYTQMCDKTNIRTAILNASEGKTKNSHVVEVLKNIDKYIDLLQEMMINKSYTPSPFKNMVVKTPTKTRNISKLPFFPDRCVHHLISLVMLPKWNNVISDNTFGSWKDRGINCKNKHFSITHRIKKIISSFNYNVDLYCLKLDIKKCYESVNTDIACSVLERWCKDKDANNLMRMILKSSDGLPIGSYISQLVINLYLTPLDRYIQKEYPHLKFVRYMDDIAIFSTDKKELHECMHRVQNFLFYELDLELNNKRSVFKIGKHNKECCLDMCGYRFFRNYTLLRKRIKNNMISKLDNPKSVASYFGYLKYCESMNLINTYHIFEKMKITNEQ